MGSFDVGCGLTNISISAGDKVGLLLLAKPIYDDSGVRQNSNSITYIRCTSVFAPYLPPIYGEYDDYGSIDNIEPSVTTNLLEEMFNASIVSILNAIGRGGSLYHNDDPIAQMYMPEELRQHFDYRSNDKNLMEALGFTHSITKDKDILFENERFIVTGIMTNGTLYYSWNVVDKKLKVVSSDAHDIKHVLALINKATGGYIGYPQETWEKIKLLTELGGMFFLREAKEKLVPLTYKHVDYWYKPLEQIKNDTAKFLTNLSQVKYAADKDYAIIMLSTDWSQQTREITSFPSDKMELMGAYASAPEEFSEMSDIVAAANKLNRLLMPTFSGDQYGSESFTLEALEISRSILNKKIKRFQ